MKGSVTSLLRLIPSALFSLPTFASSTKLIPKIRDDSCYLAIHAAASYPTRALCCSVGGTRATVREALGLQTFAACEFYWYLLWHAFKERHTLRNEGPHLWTRHGSGMVIFISPEVFYPNGVWVLHVFVDQVEDTSWIVGKRLTSFKQNSEDFVPICKPQQLERLS